MTGHNQHVGQLHEQSITQNKRKHVLFTIKNTTCDGRLVFKVDKNIKACIIIFIFLNDEMWLNSSLILFCLIHLFRFNSYIS